MKTSSGWRVKKGENLIQLLQKMQAALEQKGEPKECGGYYKAILTDEQVEVLLHEMRGKCLFTDPSGPAKDLQQWIEPNEEWIATVSSVLVVRLRS